MWQDLTAVIISLLTGFMGILFAAYLSWKVLRKDPGTPAMQEISEAIQQGAMAFLRREYRSIAIFVALVAALLFFAVSKKTAFAFVAGAFCSVSAGYLGMRIATKANCRTAQAASQSYNEAIGVAFPGGAVMGMNVVGLGLFGLSLVYLIYIWHGLQRQPNLSQAIFEATQLIAGFSMGASSVALFARVGGGIYTKAADVGADLVGKVEKNIPEDDPRNPAVIADNVGDNVGDVAGMGADLFESYIGAIVSALVIAVSAMDVGIKRVMLSMLLSSVGILATIIGVFFVRTDEKTDPQTALRRGMIVSAVLLIIGAYLCTHIWYGSLNLFWAVLSGLLAGMIVGFVAEYFTSGKTVEKIAAKAKTGPATVLIEGMAIAMNSTVIPLVVIALATIISYYFAGIFGIALSAIGMLSITGMTVAVDAYGPIADNAAGIAEMAHMGPEVRKRCETLDAVGNTTAAISKGFAIGSAALTALALFVAYSQVISLTSINAMNATVVAGMFIGGIVPFFFSSKAMQAVGEAAFKVVEEVRRQFKEIPGLMEGKAKPDYAKCVDITTAFALQKMVFPSVMALIIPVIVGIFISPTALGGLLVGSLVSGVPLAIFFANAGGAWDNSKKYIETGNLGGKGSDAHKAAVIGDTVGDPFKDTAGPSLNILLKLMAVVSLVLAPLILKLHTALFAWIAW
ncbi:MAG: sodium-translocating pyrophosphatase [Elusimicrobia bacterium]|nr:sodium-translocating pyrophosphatase [Elusimicrobiota bacterium]